MNFIMMCSCPLEKLITIKYTFHIKHADIRRKYKHVIVFTLQTRYDTLTPKYHHTATRQLRGVFAEKVFVIAQVARNICPSAATNQDRQIV